MTTLLELWRREELRFLFIGAVNTGLGYLIFAVLFVLLQQWIHYLVIGLIAHAVSVCIAFANHRYLVFRSRTPWFREFLRFNISLLAMLLAGLSALFVFVELGGVHPLLAQAILTPSVAVLTYFVHRRYSFRGPGGDVR